MPYTKEDFHRDLVLDYLDEVPAEVVLSRYKPEDRLSGMSKEEILSGMSKEEIQAYLEKMK